MAFPAWNRLAEEAPAWAGVTGTAEVFLKRKQDHPNILRVIRIDLHTTMLQLLGIDYNRFSYKFQSLDSRLTGVEHPKVIQEILS